MKLSLLARFSAYCWTLGLIIGVTTSPANADSSDLTALSLEDLMNVKVTSVTKSPNDLRTSPAAVFIITREDIRRAPANSIPELLRIVPGLHVAQVDGNRWAISARGANGLFANKLLVLLDGRTVYSPVYSGVFWDVQDTALEDIERIEVIRGPGAALWGANAVNGIINIITRSAHETKDILLSGGGGKEEEGFGTVRVGGALTAATDARIYAKAFARGDQTQETGGENYDDHSQGQAGFRTDSQFGDNAVTLQGDIYQGSDQDEAAVPSSIPPFQQKLRTRTAVRGGNVLTRWSRQIFGDDELQLQAYFDRTERYGGVIDQQIDTYDLDTQYRFVPFAGHTATVGGSYRLVHDDLTGGKAGTILVEPRSRDLDTGAGFIQDEFPLFFDDVHLTLGCKFEHYEFVGLKPQPSIRASWNIDEQNFIWGGFSQAARVPFRAENDSRLSLAYLPTEMGPTEFVLLGDHKLQPEWVSAYELGYRVEPTKSSAIDLSLFQMHYRSDVLIYPGAPTSDPYGQNSAPIIPALYSNGGIADAYGLDAVVSIFPTENVQLQLAYSLLEFHEEADTPNGSTAIGLDQETTNPANQVLLRALFSLGQGFEVDPRLRYIDSLPGVRTESYIEADLRIGWRMSKKLEFSLNGENLLHDSHKEYQANFVLLTPAEIDRKLFAKVTWRF